MSKYKAIIWDLDGTLLDTLADLAISTNYALQKNGYPTRTTDEVRSFVGNGILQLMKLVVPGEKSVERFEKTFNDFKVFYGEHCEDNTKPYDGIDFFLEKATERGICMAIVSNKADFAVKKLASKYFGETIRVAIGENEAAGIRKKPAPEMVFKALEELGIEKKDAVYIGDSEVDVATARNAGMECLSVTWGFRTEEQLLKAGATHLIHTEAELENYLF